MQPGHVVVAPLPAESASVAFHIGQKLRHRRRSLGLSQQRLASQAGISFQQLQKYEQGKNELNVQRMMAFASLLGVPVTYFFEGLGDAPATATEIGESVPDTRETHALARHHRTIPDAAVRQSLTRLACNLAGERAGDDELGAGPLTSRDL